MVLRHPPILGHARRFLATSAAFAFHDPFWIPCVHTTELAARGRHDSTDANVSSIDDKGHLHVLTTHKTAACASEAVSEWPPGPVVLEGCKPQSLHLCGRLPRLRQSSVGLWFVTARSSIPHIALNSADHNL
eukprot:6175927-Pleurochrysis_carterae.AAC.5